MMSSSSRLSRVLGYLGTTANNLNAVCDGTLRRDPHGLQVTLFLVTLWLSWPAFLWGFAWLFAEKRFATRRAAAEKSAGRALGGAARLEALLSMLQGATRPIATFVRAVASLGVQGLRRVRGFTLDFSSTDMHTSSSSSSGGNKGETELLDTTNDTRQTIL